MNYKIKLFSETFRVLLIMAVCAWIIFAAFIIFAGGTDGCTSETFRQFFAGLALVAGILSAPPLLYGLIRLLFWPNGSKSNSTWVAGWLVGIGVGVFVAAVILFAIAISQYGCN